MTINYELKADLLERGFVPSENGMHMHYAFGSISNYKKCTVCIGHRVWGDMANDWFCSVRFESFMESGQPEVDHHTVSESYMAESKVSEFLSSKCIWTKAEIEERRARLRKRMRG